MACIVNMDYRDGRLARVTASNVGSIVVNDCLDGKDAEPFVGIHFVGQPMLSGYLTPEVARDLYATLAKIFSREGVDHGQT